MRQLLKPNGYKTRKMLTCWIVVSCNDFHLFHCSLHKLTFAIMSLNYYIRDKQKKHLVDLWQKKLKEFLQMMEYMKRNKRHNTVRRMDSVTCKPTQKT